MATHCHGGLSELCYVACSPGDRALPEHDRETGLAGQAQSGSSGVTADSLLLTDMHFCTAQLV